MPIATIKGTPESVPKGEHLRYLQLWDIYGPLLTETRREICEQYYALDLSLSEIAEQKGISKQAVSDTLKTSRRLLDSYEKKLHFGEMTKRYDLAVSEMMTRVTRAMEQFAEAHPELSEEIKAIADMVSVGEAIDLGQEE